MKTNHRSVRIYRDYLPWHSPSTRAIVCKLLFLLILLCLLGCFPGSPAPRSLSVAPAAPGPESEWELALKQKDPDIYLLKGAGENDPVFLTAFKKCDVRKGASTTALARELLVGMRDIVIKRQEHLERSERPLLFSLVEARLDKLPINLAAFSQKDGECITDIVIWSEVSNQNGLWPIFHNAEPLQLAAILKSLHLSP